MPEDRLSIKPTSIEISDSQKSSAKKCGSLLKNRVLKVNRAHEERASEVSMLFDSFAGKVALTDNKSIEGAYCPPFGHLKNFQNFMCVQHQKTLPPKV